LKEKSENGKVARGPLKVRKRAKDPMRGTTANYNKTETKTKRIYNTTSK